MQTLFQDLRYGIRMLRKQPGYTLVAVITLALGIGANTAIFSVVNAVLLGALPYADADRLAIVWETQRKRNWAENVINLGNFFDWKEQNTVFADMAAFFDSTFIMTNDGQPEEVPSQLATTNLFSLLGVNPILGRTFASDDGKEGQPRIAVISYSLWQRRFGGDPKIVGRKLFSQGQETTVIGVLPANFAWHVKKGSMTRKSAELWLPWQISEENRRRRGRFAMAVARIKPDVTLTQARAEMNTIGARLAQQYQDFNTGWGVNVVPLRTQVTGEIRLVLLLLLGAVGLLLLIACANVANLLLARATVRQQEIAVRAALGAGRRRIVRQLLTESLLLACFGGAVGMFIAWLGTDLLVKLSPPELLDLPNVEISGMVLGFTLAVSLLTGIVFGLLPAFTTSRVDLHGSLKEGGRGSSGTRSGWIRSALVITEVAVALILLICSGLFIRSLIRLQSVDPGFNANKLLTMRVSLPMRKYESERKRIDFFKQAIGQIGALPGVEAAGAISFLPFATPHAGTRVEFEGRPEMPPGQRAVTGVCVTDANYFRAMQIPLKRGRLYTEQEATEMRHVVVINEEFARKYFPNEDPLGKRIVIYMKDENLPNEIIGIVGDSKHAGLDSEIEPVSYWPYPELSYSFMNLVIRAKGDAGSVASAATGVIRALDPEQPVSELRTMEALLARSVARALSDNTAGGFRRSGIAARSGRHLWRDGLHSRTKNTRDRCADGSRRAREECLKTDDHSRNEVELDWCNYRFVGLFGDHQGDGVVALSCKHD
jgi:putative ABC transport system permease protein